MDTLWTFDPGSRTVLPHAARSSPAMASISAVVNRSGTWTIVAVHGELDIQASYVLRDVRKSEPTGLILDLRGVTFMDAAGLDAIISCLHQASAGDGPRLVAPSPAVRRILQLTGTDQLFATFDTLDAALAAPVSGHPLPAS